MRAVDTQGPQPAEGRSGIDGSGLAAELEEAAAGRLQPDTGTVRGLLLEYLQDRRPHAVAWARILHGCKPVARILGELEPAKVTPRKVRSYIAARRAEGRGDGTVGRELAYLRAALHMAVEEGWLDRAPAFELPEGPMRRDRWLTRAEADRLLEACEERHLRLFMLLGLHTCARSCAILDLDWARVDLAQDLVDFRRPGRRGTGKGRAVVPLNATLRTALLAVPEAARHGSVVVHRGRPIRSVRTGFATACRRAGLAGATPHTLRHSGATWMAQASVPMERIAQYLGHKNPAITARFYAKHSPTWLRDAARALEGGQA